MDLKFETNTDWYGNKLDFKANFILVFNPDKIFFRFECNTKPFCDNHPQNSYVEGLSEKDVAEVYLKNGNEYWEFNLSPAGAHWSMKFSDYRKRIAYQHIPSLLSSSSKANSENWSGQINIDPNILDFVIKEFHFSAIIGGKFISSGPPSNDTPDFHSPKQFLALDKFK